MGLLRDKHRAPVFVLCVLCGLMLFFGQMYSVLLVYAAIALYAFLFLFGDESVMCYVYLFFVPWIAVMTVTKGDISIKTILLPVGVVILLLKRILLKKGVPAAPVLLTLALVVYLLCYRVVFNQTLVENILIKMVSAVLFSMLLIQSERLKNSLPTVVLFFAGSLLLVNILTNSFAFTGNLYTLVDYQTLANFDRKAGLTGDPNYFSAHLLLAVAGLFALICVHKSVKIRLLSLAAAVTLFYFGLTTSSKMFLFTYILLGALTVAYLMLQKYTPRFKAGLLAVLGLILLFVLFSGLFDTQLAIYTERIREIDSLAILTTHRSDIIAGDLQYLADHPTHLWFGSGYFPKEQDVRVHSAALECVIQYGLLGLPLFFGLAASLVRFFGVAKAKNPSEYLLAAVPICAVFVPWMALNYLQFPEFYFFPVIVLQIMHYVFRQPPPVSSLVRWRKRERSSPPALTPQAVPSPAP